MARVISKSQLKTIPWKNGGGKTTEIYLIQVKGQIIFRLSIGLIASDGPFSLYPGINRTISLLAGAGFTLISPDSEIVIDDNLAVHAFSGETSVECRLKNNECLDFNTMVNREHGHVEIVKYIAEVSQSYTFFNKKHPRFIYVHPAEILYALQPNEVFSIDIDNQSQIIEVTLVIK